METMGFLLQTTFKHPLFLLLLLLLPIAYFLRPRMPTVSISGLRQIGQVPVGFWAKVRPVLWGLRWATIILVILALARPQTVDSHGRTSTEGIDIFLVLDISGSMLAEDFKPNNRLQVAKSVIQDFLKNRQNDRIGMVVFSGQSLTICPLTFDYQMVADTLKSVKIGIIEDGTAIGDAVVNAVNRLRNSEARSKIAILLTDGENNAGQIDPQTAAEAAKALGIRIYTIGMGKEGGARIPYNDPIFGKQYRRIRVHVDEETLRQIADKTGASYFRATDAAKLEAIYREIDQLETTRIETAHFQRYRELSGDFLLPIALGLLFLEMVLSQTKFRKLP